MLPEGYPVYQALFQALLYGVDGLIILLLTTLLERWQSRVALAENRLLEASAARERALTRTRETIELAPDAYFVADLKACFTDVNQAACRLFGNQRDELVNKSIYRRGRHASGTEALGVARAGHGTHQRVGPEAEGRHVRARGGDTPAGFEISSATPSSSRRRADASPSPLPLEVMWCGFL